MTDSKRRQLGRALQKHRDNAGLAQVELAIRAEIAVSSYRRVENGTGGCTIATLHSIAVALDVPLYRIIQDAAL